MDSLRHIFLALLIGCSVAQDDGRVARVTPVEKVIQLLKNLKTKVETEGSTEAANYEKFACFCKDSTQTKSDSITGSRDKINLDSASLEQKDAEKKEQENELSDRKIAKEQLAKEIKKQAEIYEKEKHKYEEKDADLTKAINALMAAEKSLQAAKPSFLAIRQSVANTLALADVLNMVDNKRKGTIESFLQVDPNSPDYKYHSQGIIDVLKELHTDFTQQKKEADDEFTKTTNAYKKLDAGLKQKSKDNDDGISACELKIGSLETEIADLREDLVNENNSLKDDQVYIKDLTERCENRAKEWDQRSKMRGKEIGALAGALVILEGNVTDADTADNVNERAMLLQGGHHVAPSFVQKRTIRSHSQSEKPADSRHEAISLLQEEGQRLRSTSLEALAAHVAADPFANVIRLIQKLVERLVEEATQEATKKGFCDTEVGKAEQDRDFRANDVEKLSVEIEALQAKRDVLASDIVTLTDDFNSLNTSLVDATADRKVERQDNMKALATAREGLVAVKAAIKILAGFYKEAGKATVLTQWSPVDEDSPGAGFDGAYKGAQKESGGILGLLAVIQSDFERTIRTTKEAEAESHSDFVKFDRASRANMEGKSTKKSLNKEDHATTEMTLDSKLTDLQTAQDLLDTALKRLAVLSPTCIDTGMSYEERVAKRDEEIAALKKALTILTPTP